MDAGRRRGPALGEMFVVLKRSGHAIVLVRHNLTPANIPAFASQLNELVEAGTRWVILDMEGVVFVGSQAVGIIVGSHLELRRRGGGIVMAGLSGEVRSTLAVTKLDRLLSVAPDRDRAVALISELSKASPAPEAPPSSAHEEARRFVITHTSGHPVLHIGEDLTPARMRELASTLNELVEGGGRWLIVDLTGVSLVSSRAFGVLVGTHVALQRTGGGIVLAGLSATVRSVMAVAHLDQVLGIADDEAKAVAMIERA